MHCPACQSSQNQVFVENPIDREYFHQRTEPTKILRCTNCQSLFQTPWPDESQAQEFYEGIEYANYNRSEVPLLSKLYRTHQKFLAERFSRKFPKDLSILDFGCGHGWFLRNLGEVGYQKLFGFDFAPSNDTSLDHKAKIFHSLSELEEAPIDFDLIRLNHVIEHLTDPDRTFELLKKKLAPGGRVLGQMPNAAHFSSEIAKDSWGLLHYPYHTLIYSPEGLRSSASRWGFELESVSSTPMPTGYCLSLDNAIKKWTKTEKPCRTSLYSLYVLGTAPLAFVDYINPFSKTAVVDFSLKVKS